jgi:hypothetical protein
VRTETTYILQTHDTPAAHIILKAKGWCTGPSSVLTQLSNPELAEKVDQKEYEFRLFIEMETGDGRYSDKVNCGMWVGSGIRNGMEIIFE